MWPTSGPQPFGWSMRSRTNPSACSKTGPRFIFLSMSHSWRHPPEVPRGVSLLSQRSCPYSRSQAAERLQSSHHGAATDPTERLPRNRSRPGTQAPDRLPSLLPAVRRSSHRASCEKCLHAASRLSARPPAFLRGSWRRTSGSARTGPTPCQGLPLRTSSGSFFGVHVPR